MDKVQQILLLEKLNIEFDPGKNCNLENKITVLTLDEYKSLPPEKEENDTIVREVISDQQNVTKFANALKTDKLNFVVPQYVKNKLKLSSEP